MLLPFRSTAIFRSRWVALLWAFGICFMAAEIVDGLSGVTEKADERPALARAEMPAARDEARVAPMLQGPAVEDERIVR